MVDSKQQWKAWLYLAPAIILLLIFTVWPIFSTIRMAFINGYDYTYLAENTKDEKIITIGIRNFATVIRNPFFTDALKNTILLCVLTVPLSTILALLIAVCLNSIKPFQKLLQTIFFLPYVTNSIAIGMVFAAMFNVIGNITAGNLYGNTITSPGIINWLLDCLGIARVNWMNSGSTYSANIAVMVIYIVWNALPFKILILLGGLQSINKQYYDAAKVDSTPRSRVFTRITVPLLSPMLAYVIITGFIGGFKEYSSIVGVFDELMGPPDDAGRLNTVVGMIYDSIENRAFGIASAGALILFDIILMVTFVNLWVSKKKVHY